MKKCILSVLLALIICACLMPMMTAYASEPYIQPKNPIVKSIFTADPEGHVWPTNPNKLYIYPSHDPYPSSGCNNMDMYHVFSTENMVDFVDEGEIIRRSDLNSLSWITPSTNASSFMWAPDAAYKDGWYYFYFPVPRNVSNWGSTWETGVVRSRYPNRGFEQIPASDVDANEGKPWLGYIRDSGATDGYSNMYDVCVRVYDGEAYIYNGAAQTLWQGKLKDDMVTLDGKLELVSTDSQSVANANGVPQAYRRLTNYHEGPSAFRRNGKYYLIYPGGAGSYNGLSGDSFYYCMADSPLGPWGNAQIFFNPTGCGTSHGSIFEFKGKWYWVYHTQDLSNVGEQRSICIDEVVFNEDGTIQRFSKTFDGVPKDGPDYVRPTGVKLSAANAVISGTGTVPVLANDPAAGNDGAVLTNCGANNTTITFSNVDGGTGNRARLVFRYSTADTLPKLNMFINGMDYKSVNFPRTGGSSFYVDIDLSTRVLNPGPTNTIEFRGYNQTTRLNLNSIEVILFDDSEPMPGYFDLTVAQMQGGTATAKWNLQDAGANLSVSAGSLVTLSYDEGAGEFDGWEVVKPAGLVIENGTFFMPYEAVEVKPIFNNEGNARRPIITTQPKDIIVIQGFDAELSVAAIVKDSGTLSYQWYQRSVLPDGKDEPIAGAVNATFKAPTDVVGLFSYYVVITNTNTAAAGSIKTATTTSNAVIVRVDAPPSTECDVVAVTAPFAVDGTNIAGIVSNQITGINLADVISVSDEASWILYSNPEFTTEVQKVVSPLLSGVNTRYIRVTAEDGITTKDYVITITRKTSMISKFETAPLMDGTINPAEWGDKVFTLKVGEEGTSIMEFNPAPGYPPEGFAADIYLGYDANNVYLGLIVTDPLWQAARTGSNLWQGCGIQMNLWNGRTGGRSEYGFGLSASGPAHYQWANGSGTTALPTGYNNYSIKRVGETDEYIYTIAVPLNSFKQNAAANPLAAGDELWFSISYNYPSASNMICALDMGFMAKNLNDARSLTLGDGIIAEPKSKIVNYTENLTDGFAANVYVEIDMPVDGLVAEVVSNGNSYSAAFDGKTSVIISVPAMNGPENPVLKLVEQNKAIDSKTIQLNALPADIWTPVAGIIEPNNAVSVQFAADVAPIAKGYKATLNGKTVTVLADSANKLVIQGAEAAKAGDKLVLSGVKYEQFFPSYSFTFSFTL